MIIMDIIFYIILFVILYCVYRIFICEKFTKNIYLSKSELEKTLINNKDKYYETFNDNDLRVRNIEDIHNYHEIIKSCCINISNNTEKMLNELTQLADNKIKKIKIKGFDGIKASNLQWIIGIVSGKKYEYGLPHTRNMTIIIPEHILDNKDILLRVLIHEKIHIYQKIYPEDIKIWLNNNGFKKYRLRTKNDNVRANPDIDNFIYKNKNNSLIMSKYNELPLSINDVKYYPLNDYRYEHPFESMAYTLEDMINK